MTAKEVISNEEGRNEERHGRQEEIAEQLSFVPKRAPEDVIDEARFGQNVIASFCLFSGGNDSTILAHRCQEDYEALVHIDTGTAVPGVRQFCADFAEWLGKPLVVYETPHDEYRRIVLGSDKPRKDGSPDLAMGFPGPAMHGTCYTRLKQYQVEALVRDTKFGWDAPRNARVLLLTGLRRAESARRSGRPAIKRKAAQLWCNPLIDWTTRDMWEYRETEMEDAPMSDVAALLHRSGECNCGAYAAPGEREELQALYPEWFNQTIGKLEEEARAAGLDSPVWGGREDRRVDPHFDELMCSDCQLRIEG